MEKKILWIIWIIIACSLELILEQILGVILELFDFLGNVGSVSVRGVHSLLFAAGCTMLGLRGAGTVKRPPQPHLPIHGPRGTWYFYLRHPKYPPLIATSAFSLVSGL